MSAQQTRCLVTGATGYVGSRLIPRLLDDGFAVRALARTPDKLATVPWRDRVQVARGDLVDADSLTDAFTGVDVVYYLVHSMGTSEDFAAEERRAAQNVVTAARRANVRRIVYLSGLHPESTELSTHLASRTAVGEILIGSGIETVVLQAGVVVGSGSASFEMIRHLTDRLPVMTTPRWVRNKIQPIAIADAVYYLSAAATAAVPISRAWDIGGPDVLEYGDMMRIYAEVAGLSRRRILVLPVLTPRIAALWVGLVTPIPSGLARPLVESLHCDAIMNNHDIDTVVDPPPDGLTPYRRAVSAALARAGCTPTWDTGIASQLPSDPDWAGPIVYTDTRYQHTPATPERLWEVVRDNVPRRWRVEDREPGTALRLRAQGRHAGERWLEMRVTSAPGGSCVEQRDIVYPRGLLGRMYWYVGRPLRAMSSAARVRRIASAAVRAG
ncbi:DUF2867 domain-containing protein [Mycolicibacterium sphagni]|uniref:NAD(P)-binding domain-containing protein n=1 Tax=Mycolicibacterium sphagni TaxID=1786 RepID=A0A255DSJ4_9MYCO|nr:DUF2867 domain-containing protein [Mycolicibacterium sphagni]OYN81661.1 hypothetical protein CG716_04665 [Mycolicibacterium sphagni]